MAGRACVQLAIKRLAMDLRSERDAQSSSALPRCRLLTGAREFKEDAPGASTGSSKGVIDRVPSQPSATAFSRIDSTREFMLTRRRAAWMAILR